jgi:hypothetical protein
MSHKKSPQTGVKVFETHANTPEPDEEMTRQKEFKSRNNYYLIFLGVNPHLLKREL